MELPSNVQNREFLKQQQTRTQEDPEKKFSNDSESLHRFLPNRRIAMEIDEWLVGYPDGERPTAERVIPVSIF